MSKTKALKPCPFCGAKPGTLARPDNIDGTEFYAAVFCHCDGYSATAHAGCRRKTQDEATSAAHAAWNHRAALAAQQAPEPSAPTIAAWAMQIPGCDGSADWVELGPDKPAPVDGVVARALVWADEAGQSAQQAPAAQPVADAVPLFWYRPCRDGLYEGPHHHNSVGGRMLRDEKPGEWVPLYAGAAPVAQQAEPQPAHAMTPQRARYFMERFQREEKLLGPNEQRALAYVIAMLEAAAAHPQQPGGASALIALRGAMPHVYADDAAAHPRQPAPRQLDYSALVEAAFSRHGYAQGTARCVAFKHGAEWAISTGTATTAPATEKEQQQ
jgi:Lar family restriction alleviation protein